MTMKEVGDIKVEIIAAGKLRRYHGMSLWRHLTQVRAILLPNIIDGFKLSVGFVQSLIRLWRYKPDVVFTKGGFVCLPVGLASRLFSIPLVIHDSDAHPGLTNRLLSKYATRIATGAPLKYYTYPKDRTTYTGIPVITSASAVSTDEQVSLKAQLGFDRHEPLVLVTGGGLGAKRLNDTVTTVLDDLLAFTSVALVAGKTNKADVPRGRSKATRKFKAYGYVPSGEMIRLMNAADVVVTRAGATTLLELALLKKPTVIVPNDLLTGGHQTKNAAVYEHAGAAMVLKEADLTLNPLSLVDGINAVLLNKRLMRSLSKKIGELAKPNAARDMADIIVSVAKKHRADAK